MDEINDNYVMPFGRHNGKKIANVPAEDLMWMYEQDWLEKKWPNIHKYIEDSMDAIKHEIRQNKLKTLNQKP